MESSAVTPEICDDMSFSEIARQPGALGQGMRTQGLRTIKRSLATHTRFSPLTGNAPVYAWLDDVILEEAVPSIVIRVPIE